MARSRGEQTGLIETVFSPPASLLQRHLAFWRMENVDRPLVGVYLGEELVDDVYQVGQEGGRLSAGDMRPERLFDSHWRDHLALQRIDQDLICPVQPLYSVPWMEAMLGCSIRIQAQAVWAETVLEGDKPIGGFEPEWCLAWEEAAVHAMRVLSAHFTPLGLPLAGPFLRGPADVIAALIGANRLCYEVIDRPEQVMRLAHFCAQAWIRASRQMMDLVPVWRNGYVVGGRCIYAPGPCTYMSEDITCIISPGVYRRVFLPYDLTMAEQFPYGFMHRHSVSLQHLEALLALPPGWVIEVTMDPSGPKVAEILPVLQRIQQAGRPLIVFGLNDPDEVGRLAGGLSPRGLCVYLQADSDDQAQCLVAVARNTQGRS